MTNKETINVQAIAEKRFGKDKLAELQNLYSGRKLNIIVVEDKVAVLAPITAKAVANYTRRIVYDEAGGIDVASKELLNELWLAGDDCIRDDEDYFISAMMMVQNLVEIKQGSFGKL